MKLISAGLPRTATTTEMFALEQLGFSPCYHMRDLLMDLESGLPLWEAVADGNPDWEAIFGDASSTCDWPSAYFYRELMEHYPDAKVLLSVRGAEEWSRSMEKTIWGMWFGDTVLHHMNEARMVVDPLWARYIALMSRLNFDEGGAFPGADDMPKLMAAMERWNDQVKADVPAERLLVWKPEEGVAPIAAFLEVERPAEELPRLNDTKAFREGIIGGAIDTVTDWWASREQSAEGLHGATLS